MRPAHWVVCKTCGNQFDVSKRGGYFDGKRYICKRCGKLVKKQAEAEGLKEKSWFSRNWKVVMGIFFLIGGWGNLGVHWDGFLFGIIVGIGLLFWQYYPPFLAKKQLKRQFEVEKREKAEQAESERKAIEEQIKHCTSCGARTKGIVCEYCGSVLA